VLPYLDLNLEDRLLGQEFLDQDLESRLLLPFRGQRLEGHLEDQ